jgi:hypothetical protein
MTNSELLNMLENILQELSSLRKELEEIKNNTRKEWPDHPAIPYPWWPGYPGAPIVTCTTSTDWPSPTHEDHPLKTK